MIAAVRFKNFKALRSTQVRLEPFNLLLGPNGSGKTSLLEAVLRLRALAGMPSAQTAELAHPAAHGPQIEFSFLPPFDGVRLRAACARDTYLPDTLVVTHPPGAAGEQMWAQLRERLLTMRGFLFDHYAMAVPAKADEGRELASNAGNLAAVLAHWRETAPAALQAFEAEFHRLLPEFLGVDFRPVADGRIELLARLEGEVVPAERLSQGTLYLLAILALAFAPSPPAVVCLEEADRGIHPHMLREVRDTLYRLSYPQEAGLARAPVQVIATTHSPYLLDQFKEHPEEVVLASKRGQAAVFERLSDRADLLQMMGENHLGDLWYSGLIGGVPGA